MRQVQPKQLQLGETDIASIQFNPKSRDDIPQILRGLQHLYVNESIRHEIFQLLLELIPNSIDANNGRPGMDLWRILVMGVLRLNLNCDYDRLQELVNEHNTIRQMLGHGLHNDEFYELQTLKDNVHLLTPEVLDKINVVVVKAGHQLVKKKNETLRGRCDSYVVKTHVHFPTDINLLWDAIRKIVTLITPLCADHGITSWRQSAYQLRQIKKSYRHVQKLKHSTSKDPIKKHIRHEKIIEAYDDYICKVSDLITKAQATLAQEVLSGFTDRIDVISINEFIAHGLRQMNQITQRVMNKEKIPHSEKVFSLFQPHTEWISKGKAGVPVEFGIRTCVMEDQYGYILHHRVMQKETDEQVAVNMVTQTQKDFPELSVCSYDKGFHSPANQIDLKQHLALVVLPKKGRCNQAEKERQSSDEFQSARKKHSAVESGINALQVHGLNKCPDHGMAGFKRYVSLGVLARNIQKLGVTLKRKTKPLLIKAA